jgi:CheY-like chemotaxis protein
MPRRAQALLVLVCISCMRIIVADGNGNFRNVLVALLTDDGHDVIGVAHGGELVVEAKKSPPDVIITHVRFEDANALEALELLKASGLHIPAIITSGDPRAIPKAEALRLGAVAVLEKPFSIEQLRKAVADVTKH